MLIELTKAEINLLLHTLEVYDDILNEELRLARTSILLSLIDEKTEVEKIKEYLKNVQ